MSTEVLKVKGMTCNHCKHAVESALSDLPGVAKATVDLEKGEVTVEMTQSVSHEAMKEAIDEAGYELVS
ncbi:copper ion binding protein [Alicyclobacillus tolerans]|uniref:copper ion binding protein n=1 Tax=Alicyclobacillus tolerans TaxID=90970 RepID=UPI001F01E2DF|nr:copper ion binding protein [Alicyclobacillus tolerans]MCF8566052.1 copper ion binding protein [Alicyclobacillus tolerans]